MEYVVEGYIVSDRILSIFWWILVHNLIQWINRSLTLCPFCCPLLPWFIPHKFSVNIWNLVSQASLHFSFNSSDPYQNSMCVYLETLPHQLLFIAIVAE